MEITCTWHMPKKKGKKIQNFYNVGVKLRWVRSVKKFVLHFSPDHGKLYQKNEFWSFVHFWGCLFWDRAVNMFVYIIQWLYTAGYTVYIHMTNIFTSWYTVYTHITNTVTLWYTKFTHMTNIVTARYTVYTHMKNSHCMVYIV